MLIIDKCIVNVVNYCDFAVHFSTYVYMSSMSLLL